jgi:asparagine synthetase B (glutamine-hydrolysing)
MCGIIVSDLSIPRTAYKFIEKRGPDNTNEVRYNDINFVHFLLHLTGEKRIQPIIDNNIACIFNGEIYNYKEIFAEAKSDVDSILHIYKEKGVKGLRDLDGEFVIVLFDFNRNEIIISSDIFHTKPLFYNLNENIVISSYESACQIIKKNTYTSINPNEILVFNLFTRELKNKLVFHEFDLEQKKKNYDDYITAFEKAVIKRYPEYNKPLVTLSSGLDSGAIACCLNKFNKSSLFVSIPKNENMQTLKSRKVILKDNHKFINLSNEEKTYYFSYLDNNCEPCIWDWRYHIRLNHYDNAFKMGSMLGKSKIITTTKQNEPNIRVLFSGIGADEVMAHNSYYSCGWGNVDVFPSNLEEVFPWVNFYGGTMDNYLRGDEYIGGCFGYETRYPFCDKKVVQEFLWLKPELKNKFNGSNYKPALLYYLTKERFPYYNRKLGFNV